MRIRHTIPEFKKVYSVYQFDWFKYVAIWKKIRILSYKYDKNIHFRTNPYRILKLCYLRDEYGALISLGDEKHIFRYQTLYKIYKELGEILTKNWVFPESTTFTHDIDDVSLKVSVIYYQNGKKYDCEDS